MEASGGFSFPDLIVLGLVAAFILLRLRNVLGTHREDGTGPMQSGKVVVLHPETEQEQGVIHKPVFTPEESDDDIRAHLDADSQSVEQQLRLIRTEDPSFRVKEFLNGAKSAFEMVLEAYTKDDKAALRSLLSPSIYKEFQQAIKQRDASEQREEVTLVAINDARITAAELNGRLARLTVGFASEQIVVTRDADGGVVEGNPSQVEEVEDIWVFERDIRSNDPNWKIVDTQAG